MGSWGWAVTTVVALSGWATLAYTCWTARPNISGRLLYVQQGVLLMPGCEKMWSFSIYPYLVNYGKSAVHILDLELHVRASGMRWTRISKAYGKFGGLPITVGAESFVIGDEHFLSQKSPILQYGAPAHGWVVFAGNSELEGKDVEQYKLVCIDAFERRHTIYANGKSISNSYLVRELTGITIPLG